MSKRVDSKEKSCINFEFFCANTKIIWFFYVNEAYFLQQTDTEWLNIIYWEKWKKKNHPKCSFIGETRMGLLTFGLGGGSAYIEDALTGCFPAFKRIQYHLHRRWLMSLFRKDEGSHMPALFMTDEYSKITWRMKGHFKNPINRISLQIKWLKSLRTFFDLYLPSCW